MKYDDYDDDKDNNNNSVLMFSSSSSLVFSSKNSNKTNYDLNATILNDGNNNDNDGISLLSSTVLDKDGIKNDLNSNIPSNLLFFLGGICFLVSSWMEREYNLQEYNENFTNTNVTNSAIKVMDVGNDDNYNYGDDDYFAELQFSVSLFDHIQISNGMVSMLGAILFLLNSIIDIYWSLRSIVTTSNNHKDVISSIPLEEEEDDDEENQENRSNNTDTTTATIITSTTIINYETFPYYNGNSDNATSSVSKEEKRALKWNLYSSLLFGIGACMDMISTCIDIGMITTTENVTTNGIQVIESILDSDTASLVSSHLYFLSAVLSLLTDYGGCCSVDSCSSSSSDDTTIGTTTSTSLVVEKLRWVGDILFLFGSCIDLTITYISDPDIINAIINGLTLADWDCISSALWFVDAILYLLADIILLHILYYHSCSSSSNIINNDDNTPDDGSSFFCYYFCYVFKNRERGCKLFSTTDNDHHLHDLKEGMPLLIPFPSSGNDNIYSSNSNKG